MSLQELPQNPPAPLEATDRPAVLQACAQLLQRTRRRLSIRLPQLTLDWLAAPAELAQLRRIATSGRGAEIRILLGESTSAIRDDHRLIALVQRLPSIVLVRKFEDDELPADPAGVLLNDCDDYLYLPDANIWQGRAAWHARAEQAPLARDFERRWQRSTATSGLQALGI